MGFRGFEWNCSILFNAYLVPVWGPILICWTAIRVFERGPEYLAVLGNKTSFLHKIHFLTTN